MNISELKTEYEAQMEELLAQRMKLERDRQILDAAIQQTQGSLLALAKLSASVIKPNQA